MVPIKIILIIALTMALSITLTMRTIDQVVGEEPRIDIDDAADDESSSFSTALSSSQGEQAASTYSTAERSLIPSRRLSRFLAEKDNATGTDKDQDADSRNRSKTCKKTCKHVKGKRMHCCDNKCVDKKTDSNNCGKCGKKCLLTETCCGGHCVYLFMDKRHCGKCYHKCPGKDAVCTLGLCNYA